MLFNNQKFNNYILFSSSLSSINTNVSYSPSLDIMNPSENVDFGITKSINGSFDAHINILRTFTSCDSTTLMTLFKALILPGLDYCSQLWSPHLIRHIIQIEKLQRSFTKFINGMCDCSYSDRLSLLKLYSLQRRREHYCIIHVWKIIEDLVPNFSKPIVLHVNVGRLGTLSYNSFTLLIP